MRIFLTGAAGLIGGEMAAQLLASGHKVVGLVRAKTDVYANDGRTIQAIAFTGVFPGAGKMAILKGDVSQLNIGTTSELLRQLIPQTDLVLHCAAITAFDAEAADYDAINVRGTANVRGQFPNARFLHVSTAYVCGQKDGDIAEVPCDEGTCFANGYEASKAAAEKVIRDAVGSFVIARPSIVIGAHGCGTIRSFDNIYSMFRLIVEGRISVLPITGNCSLDFVPIDHVAAGLMDIISNWENAAGKTIHLSSGAPISGQMLFDAVSRFDHLDQPRIVVPDEFRESDLPKLDRRIYRSTAALYASYFQRDPRFAVENLKNLSGRQCPPVDAATLDRMIAYCIESGFIRAER